MPLYDYRCHKCGVTFEVRQKFADELLKVHDECGGELERLISAPTLQFKGTGWYVTDYGKNKSSSGKNGKAESKSETSESEPKHESKSETSKSDTKHESKPAAATPPASK